MSVTAIETISADDKSKRILASWLMNSVAAGALCVGAMTSPSAQAQVIPGNPQCPITGTTVTCTGDVSAGIVVNAPITTLNVNNVDVPGITPAASTDGISFIPTTAQDININVDTSGTAGISTSGNFFIHGIDVNQSAGGGNINIVSTGDFTVSGLSANAILASKSGFNGSISITSNGDINATINSGGISTFHGGGDGDVTVNSFGNITTQGAGSGGFGISASRSSGSAGAGNVIINSIGNISTQGSNGTGIQGRHSSLRGGNLSITSRGNITTVGSNSRGIDGLVRGNGLISISSNGDIMSVQEGVFASGETGLVSISSVGKVNSSNSSGISASSNGGVEVTSTGDITAAEDGILGSQNSSGMATITSVGDIMADRRGISAGVVGNGDIVISSQGDITSDQESINATITAATNGTIVITNVGAVRSNNNRAINASNNKGSVHVNSSGTLNALVHGIDASTDGTVVVNNRGNITAGQEGIIAESNSDGSVTIANFGNIDAGDRGIVGNVDGSGNVVIHNTGNIDAQNAGGIISDINDSGDITITQIGDITATTDKAIDAKVGDNGHISVTTSGNITSNTDTGIAVETRRTGSATITTFGSVAGVVGISVSNRSTVVATPPPATLNIASVVTGTGGTAINLTHNGNDVVNLLPGSVINGAIDFGNGNGDGPGGAPGNANDIDTLNIGPGVNAEINFADSGSSGQGNTNLQSAPEIINAPAGILINGGTTFVAVDTARFAADGMPLGSLTGTIFNVIDNAGSGPGSATSTHGDGSTGATSQSSFWGSVFGGTETRNGSTTLAGLDHGFGGVLTGIESGFETGTFGLVGGYSNHNINNEFGTSGLDIETIFGGVYWKQAIDMAQLNVALIGGVSSNEGTRNVGTSVARSDYDGWFVSPSATLSMPFDMFDQPLIASARVSYAGLFLDGYTETVTGAPLTVDNRNIHLFNSRLQVMAPRSFFNDNGSHTHVETRAGVDMQLDAGSGDVNTLVAGTPLNFSADLDDEIAGFIGASVTHTFAGDAFSVTTSAELQTNFSGDVSAYGQLKASMKF